MDLVSRVLLVSQRFYRIETRSARGGEKAEQDPGESARRERGDDGRHRCRGWDGREGGLYSERHQNAENEADPRPQSGPPARLDQELPEDRVLRRPERLTHSDLARALGDADHHDCYHAYAAH